MGDLREALARWHSREWSLPAPRPADYAMADACLALPEMVRARDLVKEIDALEAQMAGWQETSDYLADRLCGALGRPTEGRPPFATMVDTLIADRERVLKVVEAARVWTEATRDFVPGRLFREQLALHAAVDEFDALPPTP